VSPIDDLPPLREVIAQHGLDAKKSLGQNFILDLNITAKIASGTGPLEGKTVLEIGPGPGGLTRALLATGAEKVVAIERDERCLAALRQVAERYPGRLELISGDALALDHAALLTGIAKDDVRIIANLPYNIATPLLTGWLGGDNWPPFWGGMALMFQKEVAQRIVAQPGDGAFGRLGVLAGWRTHCDIAFDLPPQVFFPPPKVTSSVVQFAPRQKPLDCRLRSLEHVTRLAFGQRRKMLRQSLKPAGGEALLSSAGVVPTKRAEQLTIAEFVALANAFDTAG
jgi:16S rRNA (adenine1518-N6/adenine1519-N6)-dimethyltransferase